jgi:hypothetical protein
MNRIVAGDMALRKDIADGKNIFYSQGTIITSGAMTILQNKGVVLDQSQVMRAIGPAVSYSDWYNTAGKTVPISNIFYDHNSDD